MKQIRANITTRLEHSASTHPHAYVIAGILVASAAIFVDNVVGFAVFGTGITLFEVPFYAMLAVLSVLPLLYSEKSWADLVHIHVYVIAGGFMIGLGLGSIHGNLPEESAALAAMPLAALTVSLSLGAIYALAVLGSIGLIGEALSKLSEMGVLP